MVKIGLIQNAWAELFYKHTAPLIRLLNNEESSSCHVVVLAQQCLSHVVMTFGLLGLSATRAMKRKIALNAAKYEIEADSSQSEIRIIAKHKEWEPVAFITHNLLEELLETEWKENLASVHTAVEEFARERGWLDKYSNKLLQISLGAEVGELGQELEWVAPDTEISLEKKSAIARELADVGIYLCHIIRVNSLTDNSPIESK